MALIEARGGAQLRPLASRIDAWAEATLRPYLESAIPPAVPDRVKEIHDPIAGRIPVRASEVYLLDSPLLQRLRYIRQLGVAHFLFPTTGYSRFEHTIGAFARAIEMLAALRNTRVDPAPQSLHSPDYEAGVRLAALLHDVGHCPFSHVTEKFYASHGDVIAGIEAVHAATSRSVTASELVSILITTSPAVRELTDRAGIRATATETLRGSGLLDFAACCIAGSTEATAPNSYLAQIINGAVDCDKLDYLSRDAHMAGTPIALDTGRLISKLRVAQLPHRVTGVRSHILGVDISGARALDELLASRVFLYDKLYFHQKVLAAEELIRQALELLREQNPVVQDPAELLQYSDEQLLHFTDLAHLFPDVEATAEARELLRRVLYRQLPKRAFAFAMRFLERTPEYLALVTAGARKADVRRGKADANVILRNLEKPSIRGAFSTDIRTILQEMGVDTRVYASIPAGQRVTGGMDVHAIDADGEVINEAGVPRSLDFIFAANKWVEAYAANKLTGYVFADEPDPTVYLAAERLFASHGISFGARAWTIAKLSQRAIDERRSALTEGADAAGWMPHRLAPTFLDAAESKERIARVSEKLSPLLSTNALVPSKMVLAWLYQFPDGDLRDSALRVLEGIRLITREERRRMLEGVLASGLGGRRWTEFSPLAGHRAKSSDLLSYFAKDLGEGHPDVRALDKWTQDEVRSAGGTLLIDDSLCSGSQATSLLNSWFAAGPIPSPRDADQPLSAECRLLLTEHPVHFYFIVAWRTAAAALVELCANHGIKATVDAGVWIEGAEHTLRDLEFASELSEQRVRDFLAAKGRELLATRTDFTETERNDYALGYGGLEALIAFDYSVPAATVTALWHLGSEETIPWLPVIPRYPQAVAKKLVDGSSTIPAE